VRTEKLGPNTHHPPEHPTTKLPPISTSDVLSRRSNLPLRQIQTCTFLPQPPVTRSCPQQWKWRWSRWRGGSSRSPRSMRRPT
jgi:hypothetical protein